MSFSVHHDGVCDTLRHFKYGCSLSHVYARGVDRAGVVIEQPDQRDVIQAHRDLHAKRIAALARARGVAHQGGQVVAHRIFESGSTPRPSYGPETRSSIALVSDYVFEEVPADEIARQRDLYGPLAQSVRELADAVGLSQAGLLHYFSSKEELFTAILRKRDEVDFATYVAEAGRSAGSFASSPSIHAAIGAGTSGARSASGTGGSWQCASRIAIGSRLPNGTEPESSS